MSGANPQAFPISEWPQGSKRLAVQLHHFIPPMSEESVLLYASLSESPVLA